MKKLITALLLLYITFPSSACELSIQSGFDYPQSLRYRIDSIMHYAAEDGSICLKRAPSSSFYSVFIMHPKELRVMALAELSKAKIDAGIQVLGPDQVAQYYICNGQCSGLTLEKLYKHPDFILFSEHISKKFNTLESTQEAITPAILDNANKLKKYLDEN